MPAAADMQADADLDWQDGVPVSRRYGDGYFARADGLAEVAHVFLAGNDLPARFRPGFAIAELGFGTGLSILAAWDAWRRAGVAGDLSVTSFEAHPLTAAQMARALAPWPALAGLAGPFLDAWGAGARAFRLPGLSVRVITGDARDTLPRAGVAADAWFLDGFAPARNPEMWEPGLMQAVARATRPGGTLASYTAAGHVRRALQAAGFVVERRPGFGCKRHMIAGRLRS